VTVRPDAAVMAWLRKGVGQPVSAEAVPGASQPERVALARLGALTKSVTEVPMERLPEAIRTWMDMSDAPPPVVVDSLRVLLGTDSGEVLADLYANIVAPTNRRALGTFFTPRAEAALMLTMWSATQPSPGSVVDIGAGVGVFTAAAAEQWPDSTVYAVDVNPVTLGLLSLHPRVSAALAPMKVARKRAVPTGAIELVLADFTEWITDTGAPVHTDTRLYLGNPPYTRAQLLPIDTRRRLLEECNGLCGSRASLSAIITAMCLLRLRPQDGLCLLLPAQWLESAYAEALRTSLWRARYRRVELRLVEARLFPDAQVDAVALMVGTKQEDTQPLIAGTFGGNSREIDRSTLEPLNWMSVFKQAPRRQGTVVATDSAPDSGRPSHDQPSEHVLLADVARVRRGVATGANDFFLLTDQDVAHWDLPANVLKPVVRRLFGLPESLNEQATQSEDGGRRHLLVASSADRAAHHAVDRYVKHGESRELHLRELCRRRRAGWFDLNHDLFVPDVVIGAMGRSQFRIVENTVGTVITNNLYGWCWNENVTKDRRREILTWLRSQQGQVELRGLARTQAEGLLKLEPSALKRVRIPTPIR
jgi:hypothetical protein